MADLSNKATLRKMRQAMLDALAAVEAEYDVKFEVGSIRFEADGSNFRTRVTCSREGDDGEIETPMAKAYRLHAARFDLDPEWLGVEMINDAGDRVKIVGLKPRSRKYPLIYVNLDRNGRRYKTRAERVAQTWRVA